MKRTNVTTLARVAGLLQRIGTQALQATALAVVLLAGLGADAAAAAQVTFSASGIIDAIDPCTGDTACTVDPAGNSGRFVVKMRTVSGSFDAQSPGGPFPALPTAFTVTFDTNVPVTQEGQLHGTLATSEGHQAKVRASTQFTVTSFMCTPVATPTTPLEQLCSPIGDVNEDGIPDGLYLGLVVRGTATFTSGVIGHATLYGEVVPLLDGVHIVGVESGLITLTGQWKSK